MRSLAKTVRRTLFSRAELGLSKPNLQGLPFTNRELPIYQLPGCMNLDESQDLLREGLSANFVEGFTAFKDAVSAGVGAGETWFKFGDGDFHFLTKSEVGSAKPGNRALSKGYESIDHDAFVRGSLLCSKYMCELYPINQKLFSQVFPNKTIDFWADYVYAAVASRWLTSSFAGRIGLIGAEEKLDLISELLTHPAYQEYLGLGSFSDYVSVPQKFACDDLETVSRDVELQLRSAKSEIFLVGIGHVKSGLLWRLPSFHKALYLDCGSGLDALAGIVNRSRPYFGQWLNFRLPESDPYKNLDYLRLEDSGNVVNLQRPFYPRPR